METMTHRSMLTRRARRKTELDQTEQNWTYPDDHGASSPESTSRESTNLAQEAENGTWNCPKGCGAPDPVVLSKSANPCKINSYVHFFKKGKGIKVPACDLIDETPTFMSWVAQKKGYWTLNDLVCPKCKDDYWYGSRYIEGCNRRGWDLCLKGGSQGGDCKVDEIWVPKGVAVHYYTFPRGWSWDKWWDWRGKWWRGTIDTKNVKPNEPPKDTNYINFKFPWLETGVCAFHFEYEHDR